MNYKRHKQPLKYNGFSLAEAMIAVVVLGIAAAGVLLPFTSGAAVQAEGTRRTLASKLASDLMEEIITEPFDRIVADFDGYSEPKGQVKNAAGEVFTDSNYAGFARDVRCQYVHVAQEAEAADPKFILATVLVYYNGREIVKLERLTTK